MGGTKRKIVNPSESSSSSSNNHKKMKLATEDIAPMCLTGLNDHCIRAVLEHLELDDLLNIAQTCEKLQTNAKIIFDVVHHATIKFDYDPVNFASQQKILQHFGRDAKKVDVTMPRPNVEVDDLDDDDIADNFFHADGNKVLRSIGHFCGPNLEELTMTGFQICLGSRIYSHQDVTDVTTLLGNLKKLTLVNVCTTNDGFFEWTRSLKELAAHSCCDLNELCDQVMYQLKKLDIGACISVQICLGESFNEFCQQNPSIVQLKYGLLELDQHLEGICSLPFLNHLDVIMINQVDLMPLANVKGLKNLIVRVMPDNNRRYSKLQRSLPVDCQFSIKKLEFSHH